MTFTDYCKQNNIKLLPDDIKFIRLILAKRIPKTQQKAVMRRYVDIWVSAMASCENVTKADNVARKAANAFLMEFKGWVKRC